MSKTWLFGVFFSMDFLIANFKHLPVVRLVNLYPRNRIYKGGMPSGLRLMVERLSVERLFTDGQLVEGHYVLFMEFTQLKREV